MSSSHKAELLIFIKNLYRQWTCLTTHNIKHPLGISSAQCKDVSTPTWISIVTVTFIKTWKHNFLLYRQMLCVVPFSPLGIILFPQCFIPKNLPGIRQLDKHGSVCCLAFVWVMKKDQSLEALFDLLLAGSWVHLKNLIQVLHVYNVGEPAPEKVTIIPNRYHLINISRQMISKDVKVKMDKQLNLNIVLFLW